MVALGFSAMDALHLTLAEKQNVDYFITCDDSLTLPTTKVGGSVKG